jgi:hypothetical protein
MADRFEATVVIDRPIEEVFAFPADGENDPKDNVLEGHGLGKLIAPLALRSAREGADDFGNAIKSAVEAS